MTDDNHFAPPKAELFDRPAAGPHRIDDLPVSPTWKQKFRLLEKSGAVGGGKPDPKALTMGERMKVGFNILGFLFGPIYYIAKGMWKKGLALFGVAVVIVVVAGLALDHFGLTRVADALGYGVAAIFAARANIDYYKKMVLGENGWW